MTEEQKDYKNITSQAEIVEGKVSRILDEPAGVPAVVSPNVMDIMMEAVRNKESKETLETLKELYQFQKEIDADNKEKVFFKARASFKLRNPSVLMDRINKQTGNSPYSSTGNFLGTVNPVLALDDLSASFKIDDVTNPSIISVTCVLSHSGGHSDSTTMSAEPDTTGPKGTPTKTMIHGRMSTLTSLMRATFSAVTGIAAISEKFDDDGNAGGGKSPGPEYITKGQVTILDKLIKESGANLKKVLGYADGKTIATIPAESFKEIKANLETRLTWLKDQSEKKKDPPEREPGEEG